MARVIFGAEDSQKANGLGTAVRLSVRLHRRLGRNIKRARIVRGLRQADLGAFLGVKKFRISAIENGGIVRTEELQKLEEILGVNLAKNRRKIVSTEDFGRTVHEARMRCGFEIGWLAAQLKIWPDRLGRIEMGKRKPRPAERAKLQKLLRTKLPETDYCRVYPTKRKAKLQAAA